MRLRDQVRAPRPFALAVARTARRQARGEWDDAFSELIGAAVRAHGERSPAFRGWIQPLLDIRAAQAAARTRAKREIRAAQDDEEPSG